MSASTPDPVFLSRGTDLWLAYRTAREDDHCAVVHFRGVTGYSVGPPSDERLDEHPLYAQGLEQYRFHTLASAASSSPGRWIITFHDETADVTAASAEVVVRAVNATDPQHALAALMA